MNYEEQRINLTGALHWCARMGLNEGVANHFSVAVEEDGKRFLINPGGRHFSRIRASDLLLLSSDDETADAAVDKTAWCLHGYFHRHLPAARCLLHTHMPYATALASTASWRLKAIDQNACRFFNRVAYDEDFGGMLLDEAEAERQCALMRDGRDRRASVLLMRGHGILVIGNSVAEAFDTLYYFEFTCRNQWLVLASGQMPYHIPDNIAEQTARQWEKYPGKERHFNELLATLQEEKPDLFR